MVWEVKFFQTKRGKYPVKDFLDKLNPPTLAKAIRSIELLENHGPFLRPPFAKKLTSQLHELRIHGKQAIRIFYTTINNKYYLLHAFQKKSQKTPRKEIKLALDRVNDLI